MKTGRILVMGVVLVMLACSTVWAASDTTQVLTIKASVNASAKLTITNPVINFVDTDPDAVGGGTIPADLIVGITAKVRASTASKAP